MDGASVSTKQVTFFEQLLGEKQLPEGKDASQILAQFKTLNKKSASEWIDKIMSLPEKGEVVEDVVPAPF